MVNKQSKQVKRGLNHSFKQCRDVVLQGATGGVTTTPLTIGTNAAGNSSGSFVFAPIGLTAATVSSGVYSPGANGNVSAPLLRGLYNKAVDFQWYRITRAKLVYVSSLGSTATGVVTLAGYSDFSDVANNTTATTVSSKNTRTFDLANGAYKELSVPIPVDSAWKKVSTELTVPGNSAGLYGGNTVVIPVNTVADLAFCAVSYYVASGAASQANIGGLFIDYDVEFRGPIDSSVNL